METFPFLGHAASLAAAFAWAISICLFRFFGSGVSPYAMNLLKCSLAAIAYGLGMSFLGVPFPDSSISLPLILSGLVGIAFGDTCAFIVLKRFGAQVASSSLCLSPPIAGILGVLFLGEQLTLLEWTGMLVAVSGVAGVVLLGSRDHHPHSEGSKTLAYLAVAASPLANSVGVILARDAMPHTHALAGTMARVLPAAIALVLIQGIRKRGGRDVRFSLKGKQLAGLMTASCIGTVLGVLLMSVGLKYAKAGIVATLTSSYPVWVVPIAGAFLGETVRSSRVLLTLIATVGIALMVLGKA